MELQSKVELHTGRQMPIIGLGTWQLTDDTAGTVEEALRLGYFMIDTSGDYGTQPGIGGGRPQQWRGSGRHLPRDQGRGA